MRRRSVALVVGLVGGLLGLSATPADAHIAVVVFQGTAVVAPALSFPVLDPADPAAAAYSLITPPGVCLAAATPPAGARACGIDVDGVLRAAVVAGPGCGLSSGDIVPDPRSSPDTFTLDHAHNLITGGWPASAGSVLPMSGIFRSAGEEGVYVALMSARAGASAIDTVTQCLAGTATTFSVTGVAAFLPIPAST